MESVHILLIIKETIIVVHSIIQRELQQGGGKEWTGYTKWAFCLLL